MDGGQLTGDRPRVLVYLRDISPYGERFALDQARAIRPVRLVSGNHDHGFPELVTDSVNPTNRLVRAVDQRLANTLARRPRSSVGASIVASTRLARLIRDADVDVVYTMFAWNAIVAGGAVRRSRTPARLVFHAGGSDILTARSRGAPYLDRLRRTVESSELVLFGSSFLRDTARGLGLEPRRAQVHYIGVDVPTTWSPRPVGAIDARGGRLLVVSRLHPVKGVDRSVRATGLLRSRGWDVTLTIVGDGPERGALDALVDDLGLTEAVTFLGALPHAAALAEMERCDVFLQHNVRLPDGAEEALGGSLLEASARGVPVVATRSGGVPEAILDERTGLLVEPDDVDGMAEAVARVLSDPELAQRLGREGRAFVADRHNGVTQNRVLVEAIRSVVGL